MNHHIALLVVADQFDSENQRRARQKRSWQTMRDLLRTGLAAVVWCWIGSSSSAAATRTHKGGGRGSPVIIPGGVAASSTDGSSSLYGIRVRNHHGSTDDTTRYYVRAESSRRRLQSLQYNLFDLAGHTTRSKKGSSKAPKTSTEPTVSPSPATIPPSTTVVPTQAWMSSSSSSSSSSSKSHKGYYKSRSPSSPPPKHSSKRFPSLAPTATHVPTQTAVPSYFGSSKHKASSKSFHTLPPAAASKGGKGGKGRSSKSHEPTSSPVPTTPSSTYPPVPKGSKSKSKNGSVKTKQPAPAPALTSLNPAATTKDPSGPTPTPVSASPVAAAPAPTPALAPTATAGPQTTAVPDPPSTFPAATPAPTAATSSAGTTAPSAPTSSSPVAASTSPVAASISPLSAAPQAAPVASTAPVAATTVPSTGSPVGGGGAPSITAGPSVAIATPTTASAPVVVTPPPSTSAAPATASFSPASSPASVASAQPAARTSGISPNWVVKSFVFGVTYELGSAAAAATSPSAGDYQAVSDVTLSHLDQCLQSSSSQIASSRGQMLGTTSSNPVRIEYEVSVALSSSETTADPLPTSDEMRSMIESCIEGTEDTSLLERLDEELDSENPFSTTTAVSYETGGVLATDTATEPPELSSEGANSTNTSQPIRVAPFYLAFAEATPSDLQDFDDVRRITRNHIHVCLRRQYNRTIDVGGLTDSYQSIVPSVQMHWLGVVNLPWTMPTVPSSIEVSNDIVRCFQDPILNEVFVRELQNLPDSNGFSTTLGMTCSLSESQTETSQSSSTSRLSPGALAGIVVGVLVYIVTHVICFYYIYQKRWNRNRTNAEPVDPPTTLAWVQLDNSGGGWWWSSRFRSDRPRGGFWPPSWRGRTSDPDVPRLLSMPCHHSSNGSTPSERSRKLEDENLNYFMREIDADVISTSSPSKKSARRARL